MGFGFGVLRLGPEQFWAMTPQELAAAHNGLVGPLDDTGPPDLLRLMQLFPDQQGYIHDE
jgi:uncharacterized phage protein (TIGR02216 family)